MTRHLRLILTLLTDCLCVPVTVICAYILKFKVGWISLYIFNLHWGIIYQHAQVEPYLSHLGIITVGFLLLYVLLGVYQRQTGNMPHIEEFLVIIKSNSIAIMTLMAVSFRYQLLPNSFGVLLFTWILLIFLMVLFRFLIDSLLKLLVPEKNNIFTIGFSSELQTVLSYMLTHNTTLKYSGSFLSKKPTELTYQFKDYFTHLGPFTDTCLCFLVQNKCKQVFIDPAEMSAQHLQLFIIRCEKRHINCYVIRSEHSLVHGTVKMNEIDGNIVLSYPALQFNVWTNLTKRLFDIVVSMVVVSMLSPLLLVIACWIKMVSWNGAVFYRQERTGKNGKSFQMLKFRTMIANAEEKSGPVWVTDQSDTRYILGGRWLRRYSLDEIPQFFNVLGGTMSVIGPRPERPFFVDKIIKDVPHFELRHNVKGGLTGWAQVHGRAYMTNKPAQKVKYDLYYIANWSFMLDLKIILKTVVVVLKGEEAY
ncbi:hypothetical protein DID76_03675 [Candidatus Marinamargulisbacteria bacterium SCGC AG-414-C22]|nr:hypothetical protein DID76_03675 [Candidatus Marinamargulisbacteria bacterium SCGC AG-414-C22]